MKNFFLLWALIATGGFVGVANRLYVVEKEPSRCVACIPCEEAILTEVDIDLADRKFHQCLQNARHLKRTIQECWEYAKEVSRK